MTKNSVSALALLAAVFSLSSVAFSEPARSPVLTSGRLEQVALTVTDLDKARSFYRDTLGLRLIFEANRMLFFDVSGTRLMIAHDRDRQRPAHAAGILYFHVDDFAAALGRLRRSGAPLVGDIETVQSSSSGSLRLQQFTDTDGNMLAIMGLVSQ